MSNTAPPRLTRRGLALVGVVVVGLALADMHGARALGAIVIPSGVAIVAALVQVRAADAPTVRRRLPPSAVEGTTDTVELTIEGAGGTLGVVEDTLPAGLDGDATVQTVFGDSPATYEVHYARRGTHEIGPVRVTVRDVLGLAERAFRIPETDTLTVFPRARRLSPGGRHRLLALAGTGLATEREEFDRLREYVHGDTLRDIDWKASAKRDDLIVTEYTASDAAERVSIHAGAERGTDNRGETPADAMAEATASLALTLLSAGVPITVRTPNGEIAVDGDRRRLLTHLARTGPGEVSGGERATVEVYATADRVQVRLGDSEASFSALVGSDSRQASGLWQPGEAAAPEVES